jgi:hypothetical protein
MRPLSFRLVGDLPFDRFSMLSISSGSQAKSTFKITLFDAVRRVLGRQQIGTAVALND